MESTYGKTTLFKNIYNKFTGMVVNKFDIVIWVVVSRGREISKLQDDIAQKLQLCDKRWTSKNESDKEDEILKVLNKNKFVLMLDDIWEKVDLESIGVPSCTKENGCKVVFTTRSREVCGQMGDHEPMQVKCLEKDEAWKLFQKKVGHTTLSKGPQLVELARKVAEKCRGLPLALSVIGETMSSRTEVHEWKHALDVLTRSAGEYPDMEDKILPVLKFSYDSLKDEHIQSCFLYCALFPEDYKMEKEKLIDYWICEGFMGEYQVLKRAKNKGYEVLGSLIRANLLIEVFETHVVMHDVVREMALWIASDYGKKKETFVVQADVGLSEVPIIKDCGALRRMSLMHNKIEEITYGCEFPQLTTLLLRDTKLTYLSSEFIQSMQKLVVLDLASNISFTEIPEQISKLASLQYLDLSFTSISELSVGFQELKKLTHLDLSNTRCLCSIRGISKLSSLQFLRLLSSYNLHRDVESMKELQLLEQLQFLTITISTKLGLQIISSNQRLANCIESLQISNFKQIPFEISLLVSMENLCTLNVDCDNIKDLTWLQFVPNLISLDVGDATEVKEIISKKKAKFFTGITPFQKLESMTLRYLTELKSIYWSPLPFPVLKFMTLESVPKLRKLPLDATSVERIDKFKLEMYRRGQCTDLEWEDEDTKNRFLPSLNWEY